MAPRIQYVKVSDQFRDLAVVLQGKEHLSTVWWEFQWVWQQGWKIRRTEEADGCAGHWRPVPRFSSL